VCVRERERKQLFNSAGLRYMPDTEAEVRRTTTQVRHLSEVQAGVQLSRAPANQVSPFPCCFPSL